MKMKYYLRGLGTGIIVATVILCIAFAVRTSEKEIIRQAKKLGMVFEENSNNNINDTSNGDESTTLKDDSSQEPGENSTDDSTSSSDSASEPTSDDTTTSEEEPSEEEPSETETTTVGQEDSTTGEMVTITIKGGSASGTVARLLFNYGLVDNAALFDNYLCTNGYDKRIRAGTYTIEMGSSYEEIAEIIS